MKNNLKNVIGVSTDKCANCHAHIAVCTTKFCENGDGGSKDVKPELCVGCSDCITVCTMSTCYHVWT